MTKVSKTKLERFTISMPKPLHKWLQQQCKARNHSNMSRAVQDIINDRIAAELAGQGVEK
jgi:metal-responsive CopG/Arc/MetJ family transcriptional regulator